MSAEMGETVPFSCEAVQEKSGKLELAATIAAYCRPLPP